MRQVPLSPLSFDPQRVANVPEHPPPSTRLRSCAHIANRRLSRIIGARRSARSLQHRQRGVGGQRLPLGADRGEPEGEGLAEPYPPARCTQSSAVRAPEVGEHDALEGARPCRARIRPAAELDGRQDRAHHRHRASEIQDRHDEPRLQHPPAGSARADGSCIRLSVLTGGVRVHRAKHRADASQASKRSPIGDSPWHERCNARSAKTEIAESEYCSRFPEFIDDVNEYMGDGGDDHDRPEQPKTGTVYNLVAGDQLNIRATASSSGVIIGKADNGDQVKIVGEAYNGSTRWLRIQIGESEGPAIAVYGWVSAAYVNIDGEVPSSEEWRTDFTATVFGGSGDEQDSAYPDIDYITSSTPGVALPYKWNDTPRPKVIVNGPTGEVETEIVDLGPWNTHDPSYVLDGFRPMVEQQYEDRVPAQNGQVPTNDAAIDLTPPIADAVGISGKGKVSWRFA